MIRYLVGTPVLTPSRWITAAVAVDFPRRYFNSEFRLLFPLVASSWFVVVVVVVVVGRRWSLVVVVVGSRGYSSIVGGRCCCGEVVVGRCVGDCRGRCRGDDRRLLMMSGTDRLSTTLATSI